MRHEIPGAGLRRSAVIVAVVAIHMALLVLAMAGSRHPAGPPEQDVITMWIPLPSAPAQKVHLPSPSAPMYVPRSVEVQPPELAPLPIIPAQDGGQAIDWAAEAKISAAAVVSAPKTREFVNPATAAPRTATQLVHQQGETEQDAFGNKTVWLNDRCYIYMEAPPLGTPDVFARMPSSRTVCLDKTPPPGALFKDLRGYKKGQPQ